MATKLISEFIFEGKRSVVFIDTKEECYGVDFYIGEKYTHTEMYPNTSMNWAEEVAENYVHGILK